MVTMKKALNGCEKAIARLRLLNVLRQPIRVRRKIREAEPGSIRAQDDTEQPSMGPMQAWKLPLRARQIS